MAKLPSKLRTNPTKTSSSSALMEEPEVVEVVDTDNAETVPQEQPQVAPEAAPRQRITRKDFVRVSLYDELRPAPRVGPIDMAKDYGVAFLPKGLNLLPPSVADFLVDQRRAQRL